MKTFHYVIILCAFLSITILFSNCGKDSARAENVIQQGNTTVEINAIFPRLPSVSTHALYVRYNNVINAPIKANVRFHFKDGKTKDIPVNIPGGYENLQYWSDNNYLNSWEYTGGYYDSTGNNTLPVVDGTWDVSSVEITAVSCPDKEYGFKVLTGADDWNFYHPGNLVTSINFISNKDTVSYSDYDFNSSDIVYRNSSLVYGFYFFGSKTMMFSNTENYPLTEGMGIKIPLMVYNWNQRNYGSQPDGADAVSNGSTMLLTITKITDKHFDATFSGKLWSSRQADTLFISNGEVKNALLPKKIE